MQDITRVVTLHHNEWVLMQLRQSYLSSISPDTIVLTNKRIIIVHNSFWGLYAGLNLIQPTRIISANLSSVAGSTSADGKILASVHVRIRGSAEDSTPRTGFYIDGLRITGAKRLTSMLDDLISSKSTEVMEIGQDTVATLLKGAKTRLIWLGAETPDYVGYLLNVDPQYVQRVSPIDIASMSVEGLKAFEGCVFVCYSGDLSTEMSYMLRNEYDVKTMVLKGGLSGAIVAGRKEKDNNNHNQKNK